MRTSWRLVAWLLLWTLLVLYPAPWLLVLSVARVVRPVVDPEAVTAVAAQLADRKPIEIEQAVLELVPYRFDWENYGVPWYFPTPKEVLARGSGDCKSRFVVLASVFSSLGVDYQQRFSLLHFWIDYDGKQADGIEAPEVALLVRDEQGALRLQRAETDWKELFRTMREAGWDVMPTARKWLLALGWAAIAVTGVTRGRRQRGVEIGADRDGPQRA